MSLRDMARLRQVAYRLFSSALLYPDRRRLESLARAAVELGEANHIMVLFAFFSWWNRFLALLTDLANHPDLEEEYVRLFMHSAGRDLCLAYESAHMAPVGGGTGWVLALIEREYASAGLALSPSTKDLPDHVSVELEFMAYLCGQEMDAWDRESIEESVQSLRRQSRFLDGHLCLWVPRWARQVSASGERGVYLHIAESMWAFLCHDRDLIGILLDKYTTLLGALQIAGNPELTLSLQKVESSSRA